MHQLSSSSIKDIINASMDKNETTILQVDQNTIDQGYNDKSSDSENRQKKDEINEPQQQLYNKKSSKHESHNTTDEDDSSEEENEPTCSRREKKQSQLPFVPIPTDYFLITCSKEETLLKLVEGVRRGNVTNAANRYYYIQVENKPVHRIQTSTQYKNLFVMMARLREIETVENFIARIQFGFTYICRNDVIAKNFSNLQQAKARHLLPSINGIQFPIRGKKISPDSIQRAIDIAFNPSFQPHVGHNLFNQIIYKHSLLEAKTSRMAARSYEYITYEVTMKDDENSVYIFRQQQQQDVHKKYKKNHADTGHRVVIEKRPEKKWLSVHVARGDDEAFDLKYDLVYSNRTPSDMDCPFVLDNLGQIHEPIKIRKRFRQLITNVRKLNSAYHESSATTTNKAAANSSFWDSAIMIIQEITEYDNYNIKRGQFKNEKMIVEAKLELNVDEWFDNAFELTDEDYLTAVAKEFYKLGFEASVACKKKTNSKK